MEIKQKKIWEKVNKYEIKQSWQWINYLKKSAKKVWRLGFYRDDKLSCICYVSKIKKGRKEYLELKDGPVFEGWIPWKKGTLYQLKHISKIPTKESDVQALLHDKALATIELNKRIAIFDELINYLKALSIREKVDFIRIVPQIAKSPETIDLLSSYGFIESGLYIDKNMAKVVYLAQTQKKILENANEIFRQVAGNLSDVRRSSKKFSVGTDLRSFKKHLEVLKKRKGMAARKMLSVLKSLQKAGKLAVYKYLGKDVEIPPFIVGIEGKTAKILYPKNDYKFSFNLQGFEEMALFLWNIVRDLKKRRIKYLDLGNLYQKNKLIQRSGKGKGIEVKSSRIKKQKIRLTVGDLKSLLGGESHVFLNSYDLPVSRRYWIKRLGSFFKWLIFGRI